MFQEMKKKYGTDTGKSFSEALILVSTNPQYDTRLFIALRVQYENMLCAKIVLNAKTKTIFVQNKFSPCSELVVFMDWTGKLMNNFLSYCGLVDVRINASDKDLPVNGQISSNTQAKTAFCI